MNTYKAVVSFGDGRPFETTIEAKNGQEAHDAGFRVHPGARMIRILGVLSEHLPPATKTAPAPSIEKQPVTASCRRGGSCFPFAKNKVIEKAIELRNSGMSYLKISLELGVGKTTVRKWMLNAKVP
tara:strand:- start:4101 stop:4478 length:378 start_codon:yes stop_codon:yes gene_type:complete